MALPDYMGLENMFDKRWDDPKANAEHAANKLELEKRVKALKGELQTWKAKLEDQVASYRSVSLISDVTWLFSMIRYPRVTFFKLYS